MNTTLPPAGNQSTFEPAISVDSICLSALYRRVHNSNVRIWDICFLIPSFLFLLVLLYVLKQAISKLKRSNNPMIATTCICTYIATIGTVIRPAIAMMIPMSSSYVDGLDKILWTFTRFVLLSVEIAIIALGFISARQTHEVGVRRVFGLSAIVSLCYCILQGALELAISDPHFSSDNERFDVFGFGGLPFIIVSSGIFILIYLLLIALTGCRGTTFFRLPAYFFLTKYSVFLYCGFLLLVYIPNFFGGIAFYLGNFGGLCAINFSTVMYYICYNPLVYLVFLRGYLSPQKGPFAFLYRSQHYRDSHYNTMLSINSGDIASRSGGTEPSSDTVPYASQRYQFRNHEQQEPRPGAREDHGLIDVTSPAHATLPPQMKPALGGFSAEDEDGSSERCVLLPPGEDQLVELSGETGLVGVTLPQFPLYTALAPMDVDFYSGQPDPSLFLTDPHLVDDSSLH